MKALSDIVVLDFTRFEAGPRCTYLLGQLGAYIIKVEKAYAGDDERTYPPMYNLESLAFPTLNLNKHSLSLHLRTEGAKAILMQLLPHVDVIVQNFRAGTIEKMGLDWETIHKANPRIIMANNSGFGQYGPYKTRAAFDTVMQCECGLSNTFTDRAGTPVQTGGYPLDHNGATALTVAILAALNQRDVTGEGQYLESDMFIVGANFRSGDLSIYGAAGEAMPIVPRYPNEFYRDKDGKFVHIACPDESWDALKTIVGNSALADEKYQSRMGRYKAKEELDGILSAWAAQHTKEELRRILEPEGIAVGIVKDYYDLNHDDYLQRMEYYQKIDVPYVGLAPYPVMPITMSENEPSYARPPKIGEDNYEILHRFLGMTEEDVAKLEEEGVLYHAEHISVAPGK